MGSGEPSAENQPVAVLELFTSQGCSSCPAADQLLAEMASGQSYEEIDLIALSFHVDYWNRLGWKDPYSSPEYSERQYQYAEALEAQVYTPMLVINGKKAVVGSNRGLVQAELTATKLNMQTSISLTVNRQGSKALVTYQLTDPVPENSRLNIALVSSNISNYVPKGENSGKALTHINVVRDFYTHQADGENSGKVALKIPEDEQEFKVIAYLQQNTGILGATTTTL